MSFLCNNLAAFAVAAAVSLMAWLYGGLRGGLLTPVVPWVAVVLLEVLLCFPQRHRNETSYEARARVWGALRRSPLTWVSLGLFVLLLIPFVNNMPCPECDAALIAQGADPRPLVPFLPTCVDRIDHLNVVMWFAVALPVMVAVRHGLTRRGKRLVLELIVWNGTALALLGLVQSATGAHYPFWGSLPPWVVLYNGATGGVCFSTFGYPNTGGDYFTVMFGVAMALWRDRVEQARREAARSGAPEGIGSRAVNLFWGRHYMLLPAVICFFAALNSLSRAAIMFSTALAVIFFVHTLVLSLVRMNRARRVVIGTWSVIAFGVLVFFTTRFLPENIRREAGRIGVMAVADRVSGRSQHQLRVAFDIWKDYPVCGCGGWGYMHLCNAKMTAAEKRFVQIGGANVHNDYLQFLAEHGAVGFSAFVALIVLLVWPVFRQWLAMVSGLRFQKKSSLPPVPRPLFVLPPPVLFLLLSAAVTLVHALADCPFRSAATLSFFFAILAAVPGFMPKDDSAA